MEHNTVSLAATSCQAITVGSLPAKERRVRKVYHVTKRWFKSQRNKGGNPDYSYLYTLFILFFILLFIASIVLGIWAINLFIAGKNLFGIGVILAALGGVFLSLNYLWDYIHGIVLRKMSCN